MQSQNNKNYWPNQKMIDEDKIKAAQFEMCKQNPDSEITIKVYDPKTFEVCYQSTMTLRIPQNG